MMFGSSMLMFGMIGTWVTPLWLLSVGVALGVAALGLFYGVLFLVSRRFAELAWSTRTRAYCCRC